MDTRIRCLFVDLGDVIFKINPIQANYNLKSLGIPFVFGLNQDKIIDELERGEITPDNFLHLLKKHSTNNGDITKAFNSILDGPGFMVDRLNYLKELKDTNPDLKIYLLSNTNEIHIERILQQAKIQSVADLFIGADSCFTDLLFSCRLGSRKPERSIYKKACEIADVNPDEVLFIDDNHDNIVAAGNFGINTIELKTTDIKSFISSIENFI